MCSSTNSHPSHGFTEILLRRFIAISLYLLGAVALCTGVSALAETWPSRPIKLIVPFPAGGGSDMIGRAVAKSLGDSLGQPVIVDNRAGAGGTIGANVISKADPDGYTIGIATSSTHPAAPVLMRNVPYDPVTGFSVVSMIGETPYVLLASPSLKAADAKEFVAYAKANPGKLFYASVGVSSLGYLVTRQFMRQTGIDMTHVPYKGASQVYPGLVGDEVSVSFDNPGASAALVSARKLKVLGTTAFTPLMPSAATFSDQGLVNLKEIFWYGLVAPAGTPKQIIDRLQKAVAVYVQSEEGKKRLATAGVSPVGSTADEFNALISADSVRFRKLAAELNINPE